MPTAKNYESAATASGPVDLWAEMAVPGAGAAPTIDSDGTPDETENANCVHLGMLKTGGGINSSAEIQERTSDNLAAPYDTRLLTAAMSVTGDILQVLDAEILGLITLGATVDGTPPTGKTGITIGSVSNVNYTCLAAVIEQKTSAKWATAILYNAYQANGFELALNRNEDAAAEVEFRGVAVGSRAQADQVGALWIDD